MSGYIYCHNIYIFHGLTKFADIFCLLSFRDLQYLFNNLSNLSFKLTVIMVSVTCS